MPKPHLQNPPSTLGLAEATTSNATQQVQNWGLRPTTVGDIAKIVDLATQLDVFTESEICCLEQDIRDFLGPDADHDQMFTLIHAGEAAGFIHYGELPMTDRGMMLFWILVAPALRSQGAARFLLNHMEESVRASGCRILYIETSDHPKFEPAKRFYTKSGYDLAAIIPHYYEKDHGKAIFSKLFNQ